MNTPLTFTELQATVEAKEKELFELKRDQARLRDLENYYNTLVTHIGFSINIMSLDYRVIKMYEEVEGTHESEYGVAAEDVIGQYCYDVFEGRDVICPHCYGKKAMETGQSASGEASIPASKALDKRNHYYYLQAFPLLDLNMKTVGFFEIGNEITDIKVIEADHARLMNIVDETSDFVLSTDIYDHLIYLNKASRRFFGINEDDDLGKCKLEDFHPAWALDKVIHEGRPAAAKNGVWSGETALLNKNGEEMPVSQVIIYHRASDGSVEFRSSIIRDISRQKKIEAELKSQHARLEEVVEKRTQKLRQRNDLLFREINDRKVKEKQLNQIRNLLSNTIDSMSSILVAVDQDECVSQWNAEAEKISEIPTSQALGKNIGEVLPFLIPHQEKIRDAIQEASIQSVERVSFLFGQEIRFSNLTIYPLDSGYLRGAVIRLDDMTERARIMERMIQTEKNLHLEIKKKKEAEDILRRVTEELEQRVKERTDQLNDAQKELTEKAHKAGMAEIASDTIHNVGNILTSVKTSAQLLATVVTDSRLKELQKANSLLRQKMDGIEDFLLNDAKGQKLLEYYLKLEPALEQEFNLYHEQINRVNDQVDAIIKVIAAQQNYAGAYFKELYPLSSLMEDALMMQSGSLEKYNINIIRNYLSDPTILLQKAKTIHVLINLIKNAKESMLEVDPANRTLTVEIVSEQEAIYLKIQDTGVGIPPEKLNVVFTHGYTTKTGGHGFGLHSCANYMAEMHGEIWAESEGASKGAIFWLKFPRQT